MSTFWTVPLFVLEKEKRFLYRKRKLLDQLSNYEVIKNCGIPYWGVKDLIELYEPIDGERSSAIPLETKVLTYLSYLRSGNFQWSMGTLSGTSQSSASRIIEACTNLTLSFAKSEISFPESLAERTLIKQKIFNIAKIPNAIGIVDGTHVAIRAPSKNEPIYVNRKQYHSINCQVVADADYKFLDVVAKWPGSTHDSFISVNSSIKDRITNLKLGSGWFLGIHTPF